MIESQHAVLQTAGSDSTAVCLEFACDDEQYSLRRNFESKGAVSSTAILLKNGELENAEGALPLLFPKTAETWFSNGESSWMQSPKFEPPAGLDDGALQKLFARISDSATLLMRAIDWNSRLDRLNIKIDGHVEILDSASEIVRVGMGEWTAIELCIRASIARVCDPHTPLVLDGPLGIMEQSLRVSLAKHLPSFSDQLVLFCTDSELDRAARANLETYIGVEARLRFDGVASGIHIS
jgi:hypothetical protein